MMKIKEIPENLFEFNEFKKWVMRYEKLECGVNIFRVDNFYKNPIKIRNLILDFPLNFKNKIADIRFVDNFESHKGVYEYIIKETDPQAKNVLFEDLVCCFNVYNEELSKDKVDKYENPIYSHKYMSEVWLNNESTCAGGLSFYKNKKTGSTSISNMSNNKFIKNGEWEKIHTEPMVFNRMIFYSGLDFHKPEIPTGAFVNDMRVSVKFEIKEQVVSNEILKLSRLLDKY